MPHMSNQRNAQLLAQEQQEIANSHIAKSIAATTLGDMDEARRQLASGRHMRERAAASAQEAENLGNW